MRGLVRYLSIFSTLVLFCGVGLDGAVALADHPAAHWRSITNALIKSGVSEVGSFHLNSFLQEASRIQWHTIQGAPTSDKSGDRGSAYYTRNNVFLSDDLAATTTEALPVLELHEALGATGYDDEDYGISTTLAELAGLPASAETRALVRRWTQAGVLSRATRMAGGSSVVGGGDLAMVRIKIDALKLIERVDAEWQTPAFRSRYNEIRFEPLRGAEQKTVSLNFRSRGNARRGQLTMLIPAGRLAQGSAERDAVVNEVVRKVLSFFSSDSSADSNVRAVQDVRGRIEGGEVAALGAAELSVSAGDVTFLTEPKKPGFFYFDCRLRYGSAELHRRAEIPVGVRMQYSMEWAVTEGSTVRGIIGIYPRGEIVTASIFYRPRSGVEPQISRGQIQGAHSADARMQIDDQTMILHCVRER